VKLCVVLILEAYRNTNSLLFDYGAGFF